MKETVKRQQRGERIAKYKRARSSKKEMLITWKCELFSFMQKKLYEH